MIFIDTTVLVYAVGGEHHYKRTCLEVLDHVSTNRVQATTTPEAIQEFAHVHARRRPRHDAMTLANRFAQLLGPLRCSEEEHLSDGLEFWTRYESLGAFDAVLAAVALDSKYATLVSADKAFSQIPGLHHVLPDDDGIADLVGAR
ncbi:type II toxin-antitoxin system VapC family toxin [Solicola gregarius]|uniref:type II toxin-antitoxin system VapC family toxin n=1 Tax=Solicola gregarius TaxID=2908642 RepID=UPI002FE1087E